MQSNDLKYVQVCHDYMCGDEEHTFLKKGEILMLLDKKNVEWWICTKNTDDGNNNYYHPFFVPAGYLIEMNTNNAATERELTAINDDDTADYDPDSAEYVNAVISDLDDILNEHDRDHDNLELDSENVINMMAEPPPIPLQPPKIKERKSNKDYVKEHEEKERQRLQHYLNESSKIDTPEPDYDDDHDYVNVESLNLNLNNKKKLEQETTIDPPDYSGNELDNEEYDEERGRAEAGNRREDNDSEDPYDITQVYEKNKILVEENSMPNVPNGWILAVDTFGRKYYYNEIEKEKNKWFLAHKEGEPYFYNSNNESAWKLPDINSIDKWQNKIKADPNLPTFVRLKTQISTQQQQQSLDSFLQNKCPKNVTYTYKPTEKLEDKFKILKLKENGKEIKKKTAETHLIHLASSKLLVVKESSKNNKLEYHLDFKGGKCYKFDNKKLTKMVDGVRKKHSFLVETLDGYHVLFINDNEDIIDKWVSAINSVIQQIQSEFSPIYERPDTLHPINPSLNPPPLPTTTATPTTTTTPITTTNKDKSNKKEKEVLSIEETNNHNATEQHKSDVENDDESNNYDNKDLYINKNKPTSADTKVQQHNKSMSGDYYVVNYSVNDGDQPSSASSTLSKEKEGYNFFGRKRSDQEVVKIEKAKTKSLQKQRDNKFKNITDHLIQFFKKRPSADQLKQRGILQECIFGTNLTNLCNREKRCVPQFLEEIVKAIESKGIDTDGLYRVNGNLSDVQKLRIQINHGKHNFNDFDIHVLSGTLKTFFRELEDPLIPLPMQDRFLKAISLKDKHKKYQLIKDLISEMPLAHHETLKALGRHLLNVINQSSLNRMHLQNMALVFGPTLLRLNPLNPANNCLNENIILQNDLIEYILYYYDELFEINKNSTIINSVSSIVGGGVNATTNLSNTDLSGSGMATSVTTVLTNFK